MKKCKKCGRMLSFDNYSNSSYSKDGFNIYCKSCASDIYLNFSHSKNGLITIWYKSHKCNSKTRGRENPTYTKEELKTWAMSQKSFHRLYDQWKNKGFDKDYVPSVDRIDDAVGYTINNIQIVTWKSNRDKAVMKRSIPVNRIDKYGNIVGSYKSITEASEFTGVTKHFIRKCIDRGIYYSNYTWGIR